VRYLVRPAQPGDAEGISHVIVAALRETNAKDYCEEVIARLEESFSPVAVSYLLEQRFAFVAVLDGVVIGTASLDGRVVRTVFIDPAWQRRGIGRALITEVERLAVEKGVALLSVPSSVTAESFYARLGFRSVRDSYHREDRTVVMERPLRDGSEGC
jgi:predicted N-acetyltransferase YhbS